MAQKPSMDVATVVLGTLAVVMSLITLFLMIANYPATIQRIGPTGARGFKGATGFPGLENAQPRLASLFDGLQLSPEGDDYAITDITVLPQYTDITFYVAVRSFGPTPFIGPWNLTVSDVWSRVGQGLDTAALPTIIGAAMGQTFCIDARWDSAYSDLVLTFNFLGGDDSGPNSGLGQATIRLLNLVSSIE